MTFELAFSDELDEFEFDELPAAGVDDDDDCKRLEMNEYDSARTKCEI